MHLPKAILFLSLLIVAGSCKKMGHGKITGTVTETGTGEPIQNAAVILQYWKDHCNSCPYEYDTTYTDSQGKYVFYFKKKLRHIYTVAFRHPEHYFRPGREFREKKADISATMDAFAYVKIRIKKTTNSKRKVSVRGPDDFSIWFEHPGSPVDTLLPAVAKVRAHNQVRLDVSVTQSYPDPVEKNDYNAFIEVGKNDTLIYTVEYD